jgi:hypothetical protein
MVRVVPTVPELGLMLEIWGAGTVKLTVLLLVTPATFTVMTPLSASAGTVAMICESDQLTMEVEAEAKKITALLP